LPRGRESGGTGYRQPARFADFEDPTMRDPHLYPAFAPRSLALLVPALLPSVIASMLGSMVTAPALGGWYATLQKPVFTPPNIVFPLVWTFLFALMALSFWRILRARPEAGPKRDAILAFAGQMLLNVAWSYAFFGLRAPLAGMVVVALLFIAVALTIRHFRPIDPAAAYALTPYLAWVGFAMVLNGAIVILNP
jgi:tryptophan-rich sensory protein